MTYGITTARAHLDRVDQNNPAAAGEIAWDEINNWAPDGKPAFAGRYFLGMPTEAEVDAGTGFCLWAHGEGSDSDLPEKITIVPLQRADSDRQSASGSQGKSFGEEDASALASYLDRCLLVGDLQIEFPNPIIVFLEVADGTALSIDYWHGWANKLNAFILKTANFYAQSLKPGILCGFEWDETTQKYFPDSGVVNCLNNRRQSFGSDGLCWGLWARKLASAPSDDPDISWENLGECLQTWWLLATLIRTRRVPVRFLRYFDGPLGQPIPSGLSVPGKTLRKTLSLLTLDWNAIGTDDPFFGEATLIATDWRADKRDEKTSDLSKLPTQFGVDTDHSFYPPAGPVLLSCLANNILVTSLPYQSTRAKPIVPTATYKTQKCAFAFRYYSSQDSHRSKDLTKAEAIALSAAGTEVAAIWEGPDADLHAPFDHPPRGKQDAQQAFLCAAETIGQPSYTPIYFAVDFLVDATYLAKIRRYFRDVQRGYRAYLKNQSDRQRPATPYYIGVYAEFDVCVALYRAGLASHFLQWPYDGSPFPHLNAWQIALDQMGFEVAQQDNAALMNCIPVDIDVAWGDPGTFQVRS